MKVLVYDPFAGISGDMHMGALVDLGVPEEFIRETLEKLSLPGWSLEFRKEKRKGISGTRALVNVTGESEHPHRNLKDIETIILGSGLPAEVKRRSMTMFRLIAEAEAKVHDTEIEKIHFHEVGAVDSIVDIVAAAAGIEFLGPELIISGPPELGGGFVTCAHGRIPVPAPATVEILKDIPVKSGAVQMETTTPTGAAILRANVHRFTTAPSLRVRKTGYGVGGRDSEIPNLLRVLYGDTEETPAEKEAEPRDAVMIECNIDDMNPELYENLLQLLFEAGVKDAYMTPIYMKKSRPGTLISVMTTPEEKEAVKKILFLETTTGGVREYRVAQTMLERSFERVHTPYGAVTVKRLYFKGEEVSCKPEYEEVKLLAREHKVSMKTIYDTIQL